MSALWTLEDGYITVETSLLVPIALTVLLLFIFYACYFMNCGIIQGTMESNALKAADTVMGNDYNTGKISYSEKNKESLYGEMLSDEKKDAYANKVKKEIEKSLSSHLFLETVKEVKVTYSSSKTEVNVKAQMEIPANGFLELFGISLFEYTGNYKVTNMGEIDKIRRWSVIEGAMD